MNKHNGYMTAYGDMGRKLQTAAVKRCIQAFGKNWSHKAKGTVVVSTHGNTYTLTNPELVCAAGVITIKFAGEVFEYQLGDLHNFQDALWLLEEALENKGHKKKRKEPSPQEIVQALAESGRFMCGYEVWALTDMSAFCVSSDEDEEDDDEEDEDDDEDVDDEDADESGEGLALCGIDFEGEPADGACDEYAHIPLSRITEVVLGNSITIRHPGHGSGETVLDYYRELRAEELPLHLELNA